MTDPIDFPDDPSSEDARLKRLLDDAVSDIEPREALDSIHARTKVSPMSRNRPWLFAAGGAVLAVAATVAAMTVLTDDSPGDDRSPDVAAATSEAPAPSKEPSAEPSTGPAETSPPAEEQSAAPAPASVEAVPVYYVGETTRGPRLFREFHRTEVSGGDTLDAALAEAVATAPDDPDYRTDWPAGTSAEGSFDGDTITVTLGGDPQDPLRSRPSGMSAAQARMAVQQLVYTAQAAAQERAPVQFLIYGERSDTLLGVPVSEPVAQGDPVDVLAQVWIIDPGEGAEVSPTFEVSGLAAAFEATVQWELMKGDQEIRRGFTTAEQCCTMAPYTFKVRNVPSGEYTLVVHDSDASGGEGPGPWVDTKTVTVQ